MTRDEFPNWNPSTDDINRTGVVTTIHLTDLQISGADREGILLAAAGYPVGTSQSATSHVLLLPQLAAVASPLCAA